MLLTRTAAAALAATLLSGCGAIMHGPRQLVDVQSSPSGAKVETSPATGTFTTPTTLNLERKHNYILTFSAPGYAPATFSIQNGLGTGTVIADVLLTGLVGVLVDGMTGSWYGLKTESTNVTLTRTENGGEGPAEIHVEVSAPDGRHITLRSDAPGVAVRVDRK